MFIREHTNKQSNMFNVKKNMLIKYNIPHKFATITSVLRTPSNVSSNTGHVIFNSHHVIKSRELTCIMEYKEYNISHVFFYSHHVIKSRRLQTDFLFISFGNPFTVLLHTFYTTNILHCYFTHLHCCYTHFTLRLHTFYTPFTYTFYTPATQAKEKNKTKPGPKMINAKPNSANKSKPIPKSTTPKPSTGKDT